MRIKLALVFGFIVLASVVTGRRAIAQSNGAIVIQIQTSCHFFDANGNWTLAVGDCNFQIVITSNLEVASVTAHGQLPLSAAGTTTHWDYESTGQPCTIGSTSYSTTHWQETLAADGRASVHCEFR